MAQMSIRVSGAYNTVKNIYFRVSGTFQTIKSGWIRVGGVWQQFYTSVVAPLNHLYSTAGTFTEIIPAGFTTLVIENWGATGFGGHGNVSGVGTQGGGGGSGGYSRSSYNISTNSGQTFTVTVQAGASVLSTTVVNNTFTISVNMGAPTGGNGGLGQLANGGTAGAAGAIGTGGNVVNTVGNIGSHGDPVYNGPLGAAVIGVNATGNSGPDGSYSNTVNVPGLSGVVNFHYS